MSIYLNQNAADLMPIVINTGASKSFNPNINDFMGEIYPANIKQLTGLTNTTKVVGAGTAEWTICDVFGCIQKLHTEAYYVPEATIHLFSLQTYFQEHQTGSLLLNPSST